MRTSRVRTVVVGATAAAVMVGGGALLVSPAIASSVTNWGKVWKKEVKPRADKRYYTKGDARDRFAAKSSLGDFYTKSQADSTFQTQDGLQALLEGYATVADLQGLASESDLADYYTKSQADSNFAAKSDLGDYYNKGQSDSRYAPAQSVLSGTFYVVGDNFTEGRFPLFGDGVSFGTTLSSAPTVHVIAAGDAVPTPCSGGSATNPTAASGHLCVFLAATENLNAGHAQQPGDGFQIVDPTTSGDPGASRLGFGIRLESNGTLGHTAAFGSWAVGR